MASQNPNDIHHAIRVQGPSKSVPLSHFGCQLAHCTGGSMLHDPIKQESVRLNFNRPGPLSGHLEKHNTLDLASGPVKLSMNYDKEELSGWMYEPLEGVSLAICDSRIQEPHKKVFYCDLPIMIFMLVLEGQINYSFEQNAFNNFQLEKNMVSWGNFHNLTGVANMPVQNSYRHVAFSIKKDVFCQHFGTHTGEKILAQLTENLACAGQGKTNISGLASPEIIMAGQRLFNLPVRTHLDVLAFKSLSIEFITKLMLGVLDYQASPPMAFHHEDIETMKVLKARLENEIFQSGNIAALCASVGMSRSKADSMFKHLYNTAMGKYQRTCRMVYAYNMLVSRKKNVSECAYELGYTNIGHFISAFRKQYEKTPGQVFAQGG